MARFLDIIIPEYNTKQDLLVRALNSVNRQKNVDFKEIGIIIVSDGSKIKYKKSWFKQRFPKLNIDYYPKEINEGPGLTRQYGIDRSEAKFITFLDSDDELFENVNFSTIINSLKNDDIKILWTDFVEENMYNGKVYVKGHRPQEFHTLHGLFVNRQFLIDNDIRFSDKIMYQEDTYFADILIYGYPGKYLNLFSYLWKYNDTSLVRKDIKIVNWYVKIIEDFIKAGRLIYEKLEKIDCPIRHEQIVCCLYGAYIILRDGNFEEERRNKNPEEVIKLFVEIREKSYLLFNYDERKKLFDVQLKTLSKNFPANLNGVFFEDFLKEYNCDLYNTI